MFHRSTQLKGRTAAAFTILGVLMGGLLAGSFAGVPFNIPALGQGAAIGVEVSAWGVAICSEETSHRVFADWSVSGASAPSVTIEVTLPSGRTITQTRNVSHGQVRFDLSLTGGGTLNVEVRASSGGAVASASTTVRVSGCDETPDRGGPTPPPGIVSSDLLCYNIEAVNPSRFPLAGQGETVRLISPQFGVMEVVVQNPEQLCVPVFKEREPGDERTLK